MQCYQIILKSVVSTKFFRMNPNFSVEFSMRRRGHITKGAASISAFKFVVMCNQMTQSPLKLHLLFTFSSKIEQVKSKPHFISRSFSIQVCLLKYNESPFLIMMDNSNEELLNHQTITHNFANEIITKVSYKVDLLIITNYVSYFITFLRKCLSTSGLTPLKCQALDKSVGARL